MVDHLDQPSAADLDISEVTRRLNVALGETLAAVLAGAEASKLASGRAQAGTASARCCERQALLLLVTSSGRRSRTPKATTSHAPGSFAGIRGWETIPPVNATGNHSRHEVSMAVHALISGLVRQL